MINRKFFITQKMDMDKLNKMIEEYQCSTGETNPYLFMNKSTVDAIPTIDDTAYNLSRNCKKVNGITGYYHGYKIFRNDSLAFGEVEIR